MRFFILFLLFLGAASAAPRLRTIDITTGNNAWDTGTSIGLAGARYLLVVNTGSVDVKLGFDTVVPTTAEAYLEPGQTMGLSFPTTSRPTKVWSFGVGAAGSVRVTAAIDQVSVVPDEGAAAVARATAEFRSVVCTVGHADLTDADTSQTITCGSALPAGARLLGFHSALGTAFSGGGTGTGTMDCGWASSGDLITDGRVVFTGGGANDYGSGSNALPYAPLSIGGQTFQCTFVTDTTLAAYTAGSVVNTFFYVVPAAQ